MVNVQIRDIPSEVRDTLAEVARSRGQSMQAYLKGLLEEDAKRAGNVALLRRVREIGGGYVGEPGEAAEEIREARSDRERRTA